ncbi:hypothetical protein [uncultured Virgibacillus sp.]|uniref:hypothetical protein n=1 Tax=uncultured Virgibacillus sp. TaxID=417355 RepID=UPI0026038C16|nr:hypothetical protein [uncultured Virgibacillus sp.]
MNPFAERPVDSGKWFEAVHTLGSNHREACFPYVLTGIETKWSSGKSPIIYLESILISMEDKQLYFRSSAPFLKEKGSS